MVRIIIALLLGVGVVCAPSQDLIDGVPGFTDFPTKVYAGYLDLGTTDRQAYYVYVQSAKGDDDNKDPVTLWLNGGPGCSSLLGFLQQIGPFYLQDGKDYNQGDNLTKNSNSWHQVSNLLFIQSPPGVGFSINNIPNYQHNDTATALDNLKALLSFFNKFQELKGRPFWIAGESYAGKYIPDLAVGIDLHNQNSQAKINFKGFLVGNGVMDFRRIQESQVEYWLGHSYVNPEIIQYWKTSCTYDPLSAGCRYFHIKLAEDTFELNHYNVYGYCYYNDSDKAQSRRFQTQESILLKIKEKLSGEPNQKARFNGAPCEYSAGMYNYFTINAAKFNAKTKDQKWNGPCADIHYNVNPRGSMSQYIYLLSKQQQNRYSFVLYNGDWDSVVPYMDTEKAFKQLNLQPSTTYDPWFTDGQHSGFKQFHDGILFVTVKGASHMVPQSKRAQALSLFNQTLQGHTDLQRQRLLTKPPKSAHQD